MLTPTESTSDLRQSYAQHKETLLAHSVRDGRRSAAAVHTILHQLTRLADEALTALWRRHGLQLEPLALVAVGGFGRSELFPHSDIDVLVLTQDELTPALAEKIADFLSACWDAGLEIGSSVRSVAQCVEEAERDTTVQTALLERRLIAGDAVLYQRLHQVLQAAMRPYAFYLAKTLEMRQRHARFDHTPYALEPNCKESPGGLRDIHTVLWVAKAAGWGPGWADLHQQGLMTAYELRQMRRHHALLRTIRLHLHVCAGRREDRLLFDWQGTVAERLGWQPRKALRAGEMLMRRYYWSAKAITQLSQILLLIMGQRLHDAEQNAAAHPVVHATRSPTRRHANPVASTASPSADYVPGVRAQALPPLNGHFADNNGLLEVASDDLYQQHPQAILETFVLYQRTPGIHGLSARTLRALFNARGVMDSAFRTDPVNRRQFVQILQSPRRVIAALRLMNQTSVLGLYLWVFRKIVGQMQHDLFHVYTVDQHILMVVRNVRRFFIPEHAHEYPLCSQLAADWDAPWLLSTAALFHDIAKGRGGDHSTLGERELRQFCLHHGIGQADTDFMAFLVREHLTLSQVAQKQDLGDPEVIRRFAKKMGDERHLTALYLLTVADIRGTSPKVWTAWKAKLLEDLYRATRDVLGGHVPDQASLVEARRTGALIEMARHSMPFGGHLQLWQTLDAGYFMQHEAGTIAWHTRHLAPHASQGKTVVRARPATHGEGLEVLVYTPDKPFLFARICAFFGQASFSIVDAKAHTTNNGHVLDTFQIVTQDLPEHYREFITMIETALTDAIEATTPLPAPRKTRASRRVRHFPMQPEVHLEADATRQRWLLTINASDRMGLLYRIARVLALHGINLHLAKISTMGERVEDTFVIEGGSLASPPTQAQLERDLLQAIAAT